MDLILANLELVDLVQNLGQPRVLVIGDGGAQVFDPESQRFAPAGPMVSARSGGAAALLNLISQKVLPAVVSTAPPGGNPTIRRIGRLG